MAKGTASKQEITARLLETFPGSFLYNGGKEIRVPMVEDGNQVQIKITLTAAKELVASDGDSFTAVKESNFPAPVSKPVSAAAPTEEELAAVEKLMAALDF